MAQTRKRRQTKHRGNAAGMVEARGRTGRRPEEGEKRTPGKQGATAARPHRLAQPPTWRSAFNRSAAMTVLFGVLLVLVMGRTMAQAAVLSVLMLTVYVPMTFYIDGWMHRRYMRREKAKGAKVKAG